MPEPTYPSYAMQRYPVLAGTGTVRFQQEFERPYPHMRLWYVEHHDMHFDVYWVDAQLLVPETPIMGITIQEMQST